jgi:hypothetical protein
VFSEASDKIQNSLLTLFPVRNSKFLSMLRYLSPSHEEFAVIFKTGEGGKNMNAYNAIKN